MGYDTVVKVGTCIRGSRTVAKGVDTGGISKLTVLDEEVLRKLAEPEG